MAELAATSSDWVVQRGTEYGGWLTAERVVEQDGRKWRLGLTLAGGALVAFLLWLGDEESVSFNSAMIFCAAGVLARKSEAVAVVLQRCQHLPRPA
ncbi:hypothetical protein GCM10011609_34610 [Lentzea pudingi]|uniref:Uncharacterized protein n=1 Tax=Lentzea pudingi TaxID=1789439 RepID=A0ABQ2HX35_9PSEU|nr:hypothetical protein GCM10011609_34610 [Lentzea pudingi]